MMKNFMISGFLTRDMKLNKDLGESDTMAFPGEDAIMMVYDVPHHQGGATCLTQVEGP
jgi:hypothetical protein